MDWQNASSAIPPTPGNLQAASGEQGDIWPFLSSRVDDLQLSPGRVGYALFLLATTALMIRPADLFPTLDYVPIYQTLMIPCLLLSIPRILYHLLSPQSAARAITQLVVGLCGMVILSNLARGSLYDVRLHGIEFVKIVMYYLLVVSWIDSPRRMRQFMLCLCACSLVVTILALLEYGQWIDIPSLQSVREGYTDPSSGTFSVLQRLCSAGLFSDPNDLCLVLVTACILCLSFTIYTRIGRLRFGWFIPLILFSYAITLTSSRGGLMALMAALGAMMIARYGGGRTLLVAMVLAPVILIFFAGRQTQVDLSNPDDTFQTRLDFWSDSLTLFEQSPIFGCGQEQQVELNGQVAHNSFIQSYAELGFAGGACFLGMFALAIIGVYRTSPLGADPDLGRMRPYMLGIVVGYAVGLLALSRGYTATTYLILGLAAAYINLTPRTRPLRLDSPFIQRLVMVSLLFVAATYVFIRVMSA